MNILKKLAQKLKKKEAKTEPSEKFNEQLRKEESLNRAGFRNHVNNRAI